MWGRTWGIEKRAVVDGEAGWVVTSRTQVEPEDPQDLQPKVST